MLFNTRKKKKRYIISFCEFVPLNILVLHSLNDSGLYTNPLFMHIVRYISVCLCDVVVRIVAEYGRKIQVSFSMFRFS